MSLLLESHDSVGHRRRLQQDASTNPNWASSFTSNIDSLQFRNDSDWDFNETEAMNYSFFPTSAPSGSYAPTLLPSISPSMAPSASPTEMIDKFVNSNDSEIIAQTFRLYGSLYLVFFFSFCILRKKLPKLYNIRSWVPELKTDLATNTQYGWISWCWLVFKISDEDLLGTCGMDALCFVRCLRFGAKLAFLGSINAMWLIPLYLTAEDSPETDDLSDPFVLMSMANLPNSSPRFVGPIISIYIICLTSMHLISKEYDWYIKYRHIYLSQTKPRNYAVYVSGIPEDVQSSFALAEYFRQCTSWNEAVFEADIAMDIPNLEAKVAKRDKLVEKIEHIQALERMKGVTKTHHEMKILKGEGVKKVESVRTYMRQLEHLNGQIVLAAGRIVRSNKPLPRFASSHLITSTRQLQQEGNTNNTADGETGTMGLAPGISAPTLATTGTSFSSMRGLESRQSSISSRRLDDCGDIETGEGPTSNSLNNTAMDALQPSSSEESKQECSLTLPSTDESSSRRMEGDATATTTTDSNTGRLSPTHPFLAMFGINPLLFNTDNNKSTLDLEEEGRREANQALQSFSMDARDQVYEDNMDDDSYDVGGSADQDILTDDDMEMMGLDLDGSVYGDDFDDLDIGQGHFDTDMWNGAGRIPDISEESSDQASDSQNNDRRINGSLSRDSSATSRSSGWAVNVSGRVRSNAKNLRHGISTVRDIGMQGAKKVGSGTAIVSGNIKRVSQAGALKVRAAGTKGVTTVKKAGTKGVTTVKKAADYGIKGIQQAPYLAEHIGGQLVSTAAAVVPMRLKVNEGHPRNAGFVVFRDLYTTQAARQMLQHHIATSMLVEPAPDPDEVFWRNVGLPDRARRSGWLLSLFATTVLCFFWSIPMAFISSLTEVNSLKQTLPKLGDWLDEFPFMEKFMTLVAPLLLLTLNASVLPAVLKWFSVWEGHVGATVLEAALFVKLCAFVFIQTFFVSALSGSITAELYNFLEAPEMVISLLANSLPAQSSYFIQICFVFTFLMQGFDLLRAYPLGMAFLRRFVFGPRLTEKERRTTWSMFNSLEDPPDFWHAELLSQIMIFFVVFFVYATLSPITSVFLFFCFFICESGYRYHFVHNVKPTKDSGGKLWLGFIHVLMASMLMGQLTLFGMLILKKTVYATAALAPLGVITLLFMIFTVPKRNHVATHLPTLKCVEIDKRNRDAGVHVSQFATHEYLQPALRAVPVYPEGMEIPRPRARTMSRDQTK